MSEARTIKRGGARYYVTAEDAHYPGVTSILNMIPKPWLVPWSAKSVAEAAVNSIGELVGIAMRDRAGAIDYLKRAPNRTKDGAGDLGTEVHNLCERLARGEDVGRVHPDYQPFVGHFKAFLEAVQPEFLHLEDAVYSDKHQYAGSFDAIAVIDGETWVLDWKTTKSGIHAEVAMQLTAYALADYAVDSAGERYTIPEITRGGVVLMRPEGWKFQELVLSESVYEHFLSLRHTFDWDTQLSKVVLGKMLASGGQTATGSERRA